MQKKLIFLILFSSLLMSDERFTNTNNIPNLKSFGDFLKWSFSRKRPAPIKIESSDEWKDFVNLKENYLIWIGHSTFLINIEGTIVLTDPVFSDRASPVKIAGPKRIIPPAMQISDLPNIDVVTVSHNHYDHLDIPSLKKLSVINPETIFLVPKGDQKLLNRKGIKNTREFLWWENIEIKQAEFTFTPTQHWSARGLADRNKSLWGGWFMSFPNFKTFHAGDSGYSKDFQDTQLKLGKPDLSLIPIGAYAPRWFMKANHVDPEEALQVALDLGSKKNYAMHWGTFSLTDEETLEPPILLKKALTKRGLPKAFFEILKPGQLKEVKLN